MAEAPKYSYYDPEYVPEAFGLNNTGVICWLNSFLQVMISCPSLNRTLLDCEEELANNKFAVELIRFIKAIVPNRPGDPPVDARISTASANILNAFRATMIQRKLTFNFGNSQECADEAFALFIDLLNCPRVNKLFNTVYELTIECDSCKKVVSTTRDRAFRIEMYCNKDFTNQKDFCTWLRFHPSKTENYKCESCKHVMLSTFRIEKLKQLREIVVIMFNKFYLKENKWFPMQLEFSGPKGPNGEPGKKIHYQLVGQVEHSGGMGGGHYFARAKRGNSWKQLNDTSVSDANPGPTPLTYMIVYHMVQEPTTNTESTPATPPTQTIAEVAAKLNAATISNM